MAGKDTLEAIINILRESGIEFRHMHHEPAKTSEESAEVRGESMDIGGKALLMDIKGEPVLFVLSAALKMNSRKVKEYFGVKRCRFLTREELEDLTGLVPGSVPPFGRPILPFRLFADESIRRNNRIAFNAGTRTDSIIMSRRDWQILAGPEYFDFSS